MPDLSFIIMNLISLKKAKYILRVFVRSISTIIFQVAENIFSHTNLATGKRYESETLESESGSAGK